MNDIFGNTIGISKPAVITEDKVVDYSEMTKLINSTAAKYFNSGIKPKDKVAIISENSLTYVIAIFALWRINAVPVPLNIRFTKEEIFRLVDFLECAMILKSESYNNYFSEHPSLPLSIDSDEEKVAYQNETNENDTTVILFTSGSSGRPKGVEITNSNLFESFMSISSEYQLTADDRFMASLPFYHIGGFSIIVRSILSGGTLIIPKSLQNDMIADSFLKFEPTIVSLVPTMLKRLIKKNIQPNSKLRLALIGGGPSDDELVINALNLGWPFIKIYGSTETCSMISGLGDDKLREKPSSGGRALVNVEMKILNDSKEEAKLFEIGEVAVKSKSIAKGYLKNSELWDEKIHDGYYLTGDWGYIDADGYLFVVSRRTDLIISGGENIDPTEIEKIIITHPAVSEVTVFPVHDREWGQTPIAAIKIKNNEKLNEKEMKDYLGNHLSSYKLPKKIFFINELPKTDLGKIDIRTIKKKFNLD